MIVVAFVMAVSVSGVACFFWSVGASLARRRALEDAFDALHAEAEARKKLGQVREARALELGAWVVEELNDATAVTWREV